MFSSRQFNLYWFVTLRSFHDSRAERLQWHASSMPRLFSKPGRSLPQYHHNTHAS